jgi:cholesterol transport system auxiliary component
MSPMQRLVPLLAAALVAACGSILPERGPQSYFRLEAGPSPAPRERPIARSVVVAAVSTDAVGNAYGLRYSLAPGRSAFYQYSEWTDRPTLRVAQLLLERLSARHAFTSVARFGSGVAGDVRVNVVVDEAIHDLSGGGAGVGRMSFFVEIVDPAHRRLVGRRDFSTTAPARSADAAGGAAAINAALASLLDEAATWTEATVAASLP